MCRLAPWMQRDPYLRAVTPIGATRRHIARQPCSSSMLVKGVARAVMALAAAGCDAQCELQFIEAGATLTGDAGDVAIGDSVADANDHASTVMRMIRISNLS